MSNFCLENQNLLKNRLKKSKFFENLLETFFSKIFLEKSKFKNVPGKL